MAEALERSTVDDCRIVALPRFITQAGSVTAIESSVTVPFDLERVYYLYDVPGGANRGGHAHRELRQLIVAVMGAFDIVLDDGHRRERVRLDRAYTGLLVPRMIWRELENFSSGGICMVLASRRYEESDYIRDYEEFRRLTTGA